MRGPLPARIRPQRQTETNLSWKGNNREAPVRAPYGWASTRWPSRWSPTQPVANPLQVLGHRRASPGRASCGSPTGPPAKDRCFGATPAEGWDGSARPKPSRCHTKAPKKGGRLSRPPVPARRSRPGGSDATESRTTTCAVAEVHVRIAFSRTCPSISHVRLRIGIRARSNSTDRRLVSRRDSQQDPAPRRLAEKPSLRDLSVAQIVQSINRERNRTMGRTRRSRRS